MRILVVTSTRNWPRLHGVADTLQRRGHDVCVAVSPPGSSVPGPGDRGIRWIGSPPSLPSPWRALALRARYAIDFLHYLDPGHAASVTWRARARRLALPRFLRRSPDAGPMPAPRRRRWLATLTALEHACETPRVFDAFLRAHAPDLVVVTLLLQTAAEQDDIVKSARRLGIPSALVVTTWDAFTNKGRLRVHPDAVIVWNESHRQQAIELHGVDPARVIVAGAPLFDRWLEAGPPTDRHAFCRRIGLPPDRQIVLFLGSNRSITPPLEEQQFVRRWLAEIRQATSPLVREAGVLIRPYPTATHWPDVDLSACGPVHVSSAGQPSWDVGLDDALHHAAAVVGINTSAMIDAAMVGRPVLSVLAGEFAAGQAGSRHFDDLRPEHGGCVSLARTLSEHVDQLAVALADPDHDRARRDAFVMWFARPLDRAGPAAPMVADALEKVARHSR